MRVGIEEYYNYLFIFVLDGLGAVEARLNLENWASLLASFQPLNLDFQMPLFHHRSLLDLNQTLISLGVEDAFDPEKADFRGINGGLDLRFV